MDITNFTSKEWLRSHRDKFPEIVSSITISTDLDSIESIFKAIIEVLRETEKYPDIEFAQILYLNNREFSHYCIRTEAEHKKVSFARCLLGILCDTYYRIHDIYEREDKFAPLLHAHINDILKENITEELFRNILLLFSPKIIEGIMEKCPLTPSLMLFYAALNRNATVINIVYEYLRSKNSIFDDKCFDSCLGNANIISKIAADMNITTSMAGMAINGSLDKPIENLQSLLAFFKEKGVNISVAIREYRNHEHRTSIDNACWTPHPEHLPILISYVNDEDLRVILGTPNWGFRTPLGHAQYYGYNDCVKILEDTLQRLSLK